MIAPTRTLSLFGGPATLDEPPIRSEPQPRASRAKRDKCEIDVDLFADFAANEQGSDPTTDQTALVFEDGDR